MGGNHIHLLIGGHVSEHGVIKDVAGGISNPCHNKKTEERLPFRHGGQGEKPCQAYHQKQQEQLLFHAAVIRQRPQDRRQNR